MKNQSKYTTNGISRTNAEFSNTNDYIKKISIQVENQLTRILNDKSDLAETLISIEKLVLDVQNSTQEILKYGSTGLAKQMKAINNCRRIEFNYFKKDSIRKNYISDL